MHRNSIIFLDFFFTFLHEPYFIRNNNPMLKFRFRVHVSLAFMSPHKLWYQACSWISVITLTKICLFCHFSCFFNLVIFDLRGEQTNSNTKNPATKSCTLLFGERPFKHHSACCIFTCVELWRPSAFPNEVIQETGGTLLHLYNTIPLEVFNALEVLLGSIFWELFNLPTQSLLSAQIHPFSISIRQYLST